jgi:prevent-host-death family protein
MKKIAAAQFKARCLALLDSVPPDGIVITKHGRPVAKLVPIEEDHASLIGCMRGKVRVHGDLLSTGIDWNAAPRHAHPDPRRRRRARS